MLLLSVELASRPYSTFRNGCASCIEFKLRFNLFLCNGIVASFIGAQAVQKEHRGLPGHAVQAGGHGRQDCVLQTSSEVKFLSLCCVGLVAC